MRKKVLITSLGSIGQRHLLNTLKLLKNPKIGILRRKKSLDRNSDYEEFDNIKKAINFNPDCVIISSPASLHISQFKVFHDLKKPVFIEKPLGLNYQEVSLLNYSKKPFSMVGYILRFHSSLRKIKQIIDSKKYGDVRLASIEVGQYLPDWRPSQDYRKGVSAKKKLGGGVLLELSHEIDYCLWLFGIPDSIYSSNSKISNLDIDVPDNSQLIFYYKNKKNISISLDFLQRTPSMTLKIIFEQATLTADLIKKEVKIIDSSKDISVDRLTATDTNEDYLKQFDFFFMKSFSDYKPTFKSTINFNDSANLNQAKEVMKIISHAEQSNKKGLKLAIK